MSRKLKFYDTVEIIGTFPMAGTFHQIIIFHSNNNLKILPRSYHKRVHV